MPSDIIQINQLFSNPDALGIIFSFLFLFIFFIIGWKYKGKTPLYISLLNFVLIFSILISQQIVSNFYAIILIFANSLLFVVSMNKTVLHSTTFGGETKIFLNYIIFLGLTFFLLTFASASGVFTGGIPPISFKPCSLGFIIIDGLLICAYNNFSPLFSLLTLSSTISIVNIGLLVPFIFFGVKWFLDWLRGRSG